MTTKFPSIKNSYKTPWGHDFGTKAELDAFIMGMHQVIGSNQVQNEMMLEKVNYTVKETTQNGDF